MSSRRGGGWSTTCCTIRANGWAAGAPVVSFCRRKRHGTLFRARGRGRRPAVGGRSASRRRRAAGSWRTSPTSRHGGYTPPVIYSRASGKNWSSWWRGALPRKRRRACIRPAVTLSLSRPRPKPAGGGVTADGAPVIDVTLTRYFGKENRGDHSNAGRAREIYGFSGPTVRADDLHRMLCGLLRPDAGSGRAWARRALQAEAHKTQWASCPEVLAYEDMTCGKTSISSAACTAWPTGGGHRPHHRAHEPARFRTSWPARSSGG